MSLKLPAAPSPDPEKANLQPPERNWPVWLKVTWLAVGMPLIGLFALGYVDRIARPSGYFDFTQEWTSARSYFDNGRIYPDLSDAVAKYAGHENVHLVMRRNGHPPFAILALLPLGLLDYEVAFACWNSLSLLMIALAAVVMIRQSRIDYSWWSLIPFTLLMISSNSMAQQFILGQLGGLLLLLLTLSWAADRRDQQIWAGGLVGAAAAIKLFPAFLLVYFIFRKRWTAASACVAVFALLNFVSLVVFGPAEFATYFLEVAPSLSEFRDFWPNTSIAGFWSKLLVAESGHTDPIIRAPWLAHTATLLCTATIVLLVARRTSRCESQEQVDNAWMLCMIAMLLVSPIAWDHYFVLLLLPVAILWRTIPAEQQAMRYAMLGATILAMLPRPHWLWQLVSSPDRVLIVQAGSPPFVISTFETITVISVPLYAQLLLLGCVWMATRLQNDRTTELADAAE